MRAAGLSARKIEYLVDLALHFDSGAVHVDAWKDMADEEIIAELVAIRGIGRWTAEMFLIFHLMRPNVLPLDDVGLINGISQNYFSGDPVSRSDAREVAPPGPRTAVSRLGIFGARWTPCRSRTEAATTRRKRWRKNTFLDFEQPIAELETRSKNCAMCRPNRLSTFPKRSTSSSKKSQQLTKDIYSDLHALADHARSRAIRERPYTLDYVNEIFTDFDRTARRPPFRGRPVDRRRPGPLQRQCLHGARPSEGPRHQGARRCATSA